MESDRIENRDCLAGMREMEENSVDAVVCDPPYGISFMQAHWDHGVPGVPYWQEALRVAKPGAHLLAFGGTRTHHRLMVAIEDAGWELRECLMWVFGSGMPKGLDVGKAIDKAAGLSRTVLGPKRSPDGRCRTSEPSGMQERTPLHGGGIRKREEWLTAPATDAAKQWDGWNTALKPSYEPVILARKPLDGTVAETVLKWGCGGLNIEGCRIGTDPISAHGGGQPRDRIYGGGEGFPALERGSNPHTGRWPANLLIDEVAADLLDQQSGTLKSGEYPSSRNSPKFKNCYSPFEGARTGISLREANSGGASRFFYCSKASKTERSGSLHPTVKPLALMRYLCRLVTPPGGLILDPFMGSGSTAVAAVQEGFHIIGFEIDPGYHADACRRLAAALHPPEGVPGPATPTLAAFGVQDP